eukprot:476849_1
MAHTQEHWMHMKLLNPPFNTDCQLSHILSLNDAKLLECLLVIVSNITFPYSFKEIWVYNICNDNYTKLITNINLKDCEYINFYAASLNDNKSVLYLFGSSGKIIRVNLKTKQFEVSNKTYHDGCGCRSLFIHGQFHIFGGWDEKDKYHFTWNENNKKLIKIYFF